MQPIRQLRMSPLSVEGAGSSGETCGNELDARAGLALDGVGGAAYPAKPRLGAKPQSENWQHAGERGACDWGVALRWWWEQGATPKAQPTGKPAYPGEPRGTREGRVSGTLGMWCLALIVECTLICAGISITFLLALYAYIKVAFCHKFHEY